MLCTDRDFEKHVVALYIFAWLVFATFPLSLSLTCAKGFLKSTPCTGTRQKYINQYVEKNFYLFFIQSLIDMTQMFNMIYRWPSFGGPQNTLGLRISWEMLAIFSPVRGWSLAPLSARSLGKGGRASLSRWRHISRAESALGWGWAIFCGSVSVVVAVVGAAIVGDVCSPTEGELSPKVG